MTLAQRLDAPDVAERLAAMADVTAAADTDAATLAALADCLGDRRKVIQRRAAETFATLSKHGADVQPVLLAALASDAITQRWGAAYALSLLGRAPQVALPVLLKALGCDDGDIRWAAGNIVVRMRDHPGLIDALRDVLATGNAAQRKMAAYCLRDLDVRTPETEQALLAALHDADTNVRLAAISCIARLAIDRAAAAQRLVDLLGDPDVSVRRISAAVLGPFGERSAAVLAALRAATTTADVSLRRAAERSLRLLGE